MRLIFGLKSASAQRIVEARAIAPFEDAEDLSRRANLEQHEMKCCRNKCTCISLVIQ
jgi:error-prone DNA polymerase